LHGPQRRLDYPRRELQIACNFVAEQQRYLAKKLPEPCCRGLLIAHYGKLVLHQRMVDDGDAAHLHSPENLCQRDTSGFETLATPQRKWRSQLYPLGRQLIETGEKPCPGLFVDEGRLDRGTRDTDKIFFRHPEMFCRRLI